eukprot:687030-Prymnesium_polylepis.1
MRTSQPTMFGSSAASMAISVVMNTLRPRPPDATATAESGGGSHTANTCHPVSPVGPRVLHRHD